MNLDIKKDLASSWFKTLQNSICATISNLEKNKIKFQITTWKRNKKKNEGGGEYRILKNGKIFDKVGVNYSEVYGKFPKKFQKNIPGAKNKDHVGLNTSASELNEISSLMNEINSVYTKYFFDDVHHRW